MDYNEQTLAILEEMQRSIENLQLNITETKFSIIENKGKSISEADIYRPIIREITDYNQELSTRLEDLYKQINYSIEKKSTESINKINGLANEFSKFTTLKTEERHYFHFFPDLKEWLNLVKKGFIVIILTILVVFTSLIGLKSIREKEALEPLAEKYRIARAYSIEKYIPVESVSKYFIQLDSNYQTDRKALLRRTQIIEDSIRIETERIQKIKFYKEELKVLENKKNK